MKDNIHWLDAKEACAFLGGIQPATLYTYASRGLLHPVPVAGSRKKQYLKTELEQLKARHDARAGHAAVAGAAMQWGEPVLDSSITEIREDGPAYRGCPVLELVQSKISFEAVAELLWTEQKFNKKIIWPTPHLDWNLLQIFEQALPKTASAMECLSAILPCLALHDPGRHAASFEADVRRLRSLIPILAALLGFAHGRTKVASQGESVAKIAALAFGNPSDEAVLAINSVLVLCADHELNASAFAARIAASAGADLYACFGAALATLSGPLHGGACDRVFAFLKEASGASRMADAVLGRLRRGETVPGFGHKLYPEGDPRVPPMLEMAKAMGSLQPSVQSLFALVRIMEELGHPKPTLDLGLVAVAEALGLPVGSAAGLFALGRCAGWGAHVLEQRSQGVMLRPRARFVP